MNVMLYFGWIALFPLIAIGALIQAGFARSENRRLGWIIPGLWFLMTLMMALFSATSYGGMFSDNWFKLIGTGIGFIGAYNIPTVIFIFVYRYVRRGYPNRAGSGKEDQDIKKMNIKDL